MNEWYWLLLLPAGFLSIAAILQAGKFCREIDRLKHTQKVLMGMGHESLGENSKSTKRK